jgi:hypothetical protein
MSAGAVQGAIAHLSGGRLAADDRRQGRQACAAGAAGRRSTQDNLPEALFDPEAATTTTDSRSNVASTSSDSGRDKASTPADKQIVANSDNNAESRAANGSSSAQDNPSEPDRSPSAPASESYSAAQAMDRTGEAQAQNRPEPIDTGAIDQILKPGAPDHLKLDLGPNLNAATDNPGSRTQAAAPAPRVETTSAGAVSELPGEVPAPRVASLRVELDGGGSAQATIRERGGTIDVKVTTPNLESARHLAGEVGALRRSLDDAGLTLRSAEIDYQPQGQGERDDQQDRRGQPRQSSSSLEVFTTEEVSHG